LHLKLLYLRSSTTLKPQMTQQITKGIKVSVKTQYDGTTLQNSQLVYLFSYFITIENNSKDTVQLLERVWEIFDALNNKEVVEGKGVIGQTPTIAPQNSYTYKSHCLLHASSGAMKGIFRMTNLSNSKKFNVTIPAFQLTTTAISN